MGTEFRIVLYAATPEEAFEAARAAFDRIQTLDQILSDYRSDSELTLLCEKAAAGPVVVSPELFLVLDRALFFSRLSGGAFDVTIKPLVDLWRSARKTKEIPKPQHIAEAKQKVGYQNLLLNPMTRSVRFQIPELKLDLGAIAKGYAADEAFKVLTSHGLRRALIDAGGDLRLGESPPGRKGWRVVIDDDSGGDRSQHSLLLAQAGVATSSDKYQFVEIEGVRYSHIVDPATGLGLKDRRTVTVIARDALTADALATTLSVLPPEEGLTVIGRIEGAAARIARGPNGKKEYFVSENFPP